MTPIKLDSGGTDRRTGAGEHDAEKFDADARSTKSIRIIKIKFLGESCPYGQGGENKTGRYGLLIKIPGEPEKSGLYIMKVDEEIEI